MSFRAFIWVLVGLTPVYLTVAAVIPPGDDELYYWCWSGDLQLSYYDHPPMTAYLIRIGTELFGDSVLALRLPAVVSSLVVLAVIGWLSRLRDLLPFVLFTPLFTLGAVVVTPDAPLLLFWSLYLLWLVKVHEKLGGANPDREGGGWWTKTHPLPRGRGSPGHVSLWLWPVGGVVLGCGILGKYTTGLALIAGFVSFLIAGNWRRWAAGYAAHLAVAFVVALPILVHNLRHDFVPLRYQWGHTMCNSEPGLRGFSEFVAVQLVLFGTIPLFMLWWTARHFRELAENPRLRVCACLFAVPFAFFLYKATHCRLEGNWALACDIAVWPLAAEWYAAARQSRFWRRVTPAAFALPAASVVFLAVHTAYPLPVIPPTKDRVSRQAAKLELVRRIADDLPLHGEPAPLFVSSYQWTALLRFHGVDARQVPGMTRPSHFTQMPDAPADHDRIYLLSEGSFPDDAFIGMGPHRLLARYPLVVQGEEVDVFWLVEYRRPGKH